MYTANSMNCLTEAIWHGTAGKWNDSGCIFRDELSWQNMPVCRVMELYRRNIRPRDIMTEKAFMNALTVDMALGCSTNTMLHLPAIAHEAGVRIESGHCQ